MTTWMADARAAMVRGEPRPSALAAIDAVEGVLVEGDEPTREDHLLPEGVGRVGD